MGQIMGVPFGEEKRLKKLTRKWEKVHHAVKKLKKEKTGPNLDNASEINGLFECVLQNLDNEPTVNNLKKTTKMLMEIVLDVQKILEEMRESNAISQLENEQKLGEIASQNPAQEIEKETGDTNHEPDDNLQEDCKEDSITVLSKVEASEDSRVKDISPPVVVNKNRTSKFAGEVIFVGDYNTYWVNEADPRRDLEKEADGKLIERMRKELLISKMSNRKLKRENGILIRRNTDTADIGRGSVCQTEGGGRCYSSQRSNSLPPSVRPKYQYTFNAQR